MGKSSMYKTFQHLSGEMRLWQRAFTSYDSQDWIVQLKQSSTGTLFHISDVAPEMTYQLNALHSQERASDACLVCLHGRRSIAQLQDTSLPHPRLIQDVYVKHRHSVKKFLLPTAIFSQKTTLKFVIFCLENGEWYGLLYLTQII